MCSLPLAGLSGIDWRITADYDALSDVDGADLDDGETFRKKVLNLAVNPHDPSIVLVGAQSNPYFDHYAHTQVYVSDAGGAHGTFRVATELENILPDKEIQFMRFSSSGDKLYVAPGCGGLYEFTNPY